MGRKTSSNPARCFRPLAGNIVADPLEIGASVVQPSFGILRCHVNANVLA
jgi:hypothetical protein